MMPSESMPASNMNQEYPDGQQLSFVDIEVGSCAVAI